MMNLDKIVQIASVIIILLGAFGMLFCFPFLWSNNMLDLVGAGFPFVAGAILIGSGMVTLGILSKKQS